jgi:hypothetical protein
MCPTFEYSAKQQMNEIVNKDPLLQLEELAPKIPAAKKGRTLGSTLDRALEAAHGIASEIERLEEFYEFTSFFSTQIGEADIDIIVEKVNDVERIGRLTEKAADVDQLDEVRGKLRDVVPSDVATLERRLHEVWQNHIRETFSTTGSLGEVLNKIPETVKLGQQLAETHRKAQALASELPVSAEQKLEYEALVTKRESLLALLKKLGAGPEVVHFLLAVANKNATLTDATTGVYEWLKSRNALSSFRIGL